MKSLWPAGAREGVAKMGTFLCGQPQSSQTLLRPSWRDLVLLWPSTDFSFDLEHPARQPPAPLLGNIKPPRGRGTGDASPTLADGVNQREPDSRWQLRRLSRPPRGQPRLVAVRGAARARASDPTLSVEAHANLAECYRTAAGGQRPDALSSAPLTAQGFNQRHGGLDLSLLDV